jgi:hypothetical protein
MSRQCFMDGEVAQLLLDEGLRKATEDGLTSDAHSSVDGTLIQARASHKSFRPKDEPPDQIPPTHDRGDRWLRAS